MIPASRRKLRLVAIGAALTLIGCGDGSTAAGDAGTGDAAADAGPGVVLEVAPPADPAPPVFTPCPAGWAEQDRDGVTVCTPFPSGAPDACEDGFAHFAGDPGCVRLGTACPAGGLPEDLPAGAAVWFVRAGAIDGDGSATSPFGTIAEALATAEDGAIVAIGTGTYDEALSLARPITLWGACPTGVLLTSTVPDSAIRAGVVTVESAGVVVRNLTIGRSARPGVWAGVASAGAQLIDVIVEEADRVGIEVERGARLVAEGLIVRDTKPGPTAQFGRGLGAQSGSSVEVRRALFERNHEFGVIALDVGTSVVVEDAVLRDGLPRESNGRDGAGLGALRGATARLSRAWVSANTAGGVTAIDPDSSVEIEDAWVLDTRAQSSDGNFGRGLNAEIAATLVARRVVLTRNREGGGLANLPGSLLRLEDSIVDHTLPREADGWIGRGLGVQVGGRMELARVVLSDNFEGGVGAIGAGTTLSIEDVLIRRTGPSGLDGIGRGVVIETGATATASRLRIEDSHGVGVMVQMGGASFDVSDARIVRTSGLDLIAPGRSFGVQNEASATLTRVSIEESAQFGLIAIHDDAHVSLTDVSITDTRAFECASCNQGGTALGAFGGATITATRFRVRGAALCGAHLGAGSQIDLAEGEIAECVVGACVQDDAYDLSRLSERVRYADNETNLDSTTLPVPDALPSLPE